VLPRLLVGATSVATCFLGHNGDTQHNSVSKTFSTVPKLWVACPHLRMVTSLCVALRYLYMRLILRFVDDLAFCALVEDVIVELW